MTCGLHTDTYTVVFRDVAAHGLGKRGSVAV